MSLSDALLRLANARLPAGPVGLLRVAIGIAAAIRGLEMAVIMTFAFEPGTARFPYAEIWLEVPSRVVDPLASLWVTLAMAFALGWQTRIAGFGLSAIMGSCLFLDQQTYSNHLYLLTLVVFFLTLADSGARHSLDARRGRGEETVTAWPLLLLKVQLTIVYVFAAVTKINAEYLSGAVLAANLGPDGLVSVPATLARPDFIAALAISSVVVELFLAAALWSTRWRRSGMFCAAGFHGLILLLMPAGIVFQLAVFAVEMVGMYALCCVLPPAVVAPHLPRSPFAAQLRYRSRRSLAQDL